MATKDVGHEPQQMRHSSKDETESEVYHWVYESLQGQDIEVQVTPTGHGLYTIDTPWYRAQIRTYDLLDTVVRFCLTMYGAGTLTVMLS